MPHQAASPQRKAPPVSVVWKFRSLLSTGRQEEAAVVISLTMPVNAYAIAAQVSDVALSVWGTVTDTTAPQEIREFVVVGTGYDIDLTGLCHVDTSFLPEPLLEHGLVFHIFERVSDGT